MRRQRKPRFNRLLFGFRILSPTGAVLNETWINTDEDDVSMTEYGFGGTPRKTGHSTIEQLHKYVKALPRSRPPGGPREEP